MDMSHAEDVINLNKELKMNFIIDRIEENFAVVELEDKKMINMPIELLPSGAKEGDVLSITVDKNETEARRRRIEKLMDDLWE